ncbi:MAG: UbiH/UbiF/VisC/COQ6 family ubiquinone biosynthesis hydroxylase [Alphaproteobacteria bacterium]
MKSDVIIIGGGIIGVTLACALAKQNISTILIEQRNIKSMKSNVTDGRASAISYGSKLILEKYDLWRNIEQYAGPIEQIRVTDSNSPLFLHFDNKYVESQTLGFMVENHKMLAELHNEAEKIKNLTILEGNYNTIQRNSYDVKVEIGNHIIESSLLVAADGKNSSVRQKANIGIRQSFFKQSAIVCNVKHELNHENIAQEKFFPNGPFAILPLLGGHSSSIVWTESTKLAEIYLGMDEKEFIYNLSLKFGNYLGELELISEVYSYPLSSLYCEKYYKERLVLVGDAAHSIHPIAGQGLNLGIKDVEALVEILNKYKSLGLDIGSESILVEYQNQRKDDNLAMIAITTMLNTIFSNKNFPLNALRKLGLSAVNTFPSAKKFFMKYAMGIRN